MNGPFVGYIPGVVMDLIEVEVILLRLAQARAVVRFGVIPGECDGSPGGTPYIQVTGGVVYKGHTLREALRAWAIANPEPESQVLEG